MKKKFNYILIIVISFFSFYMTVSANGENCRAPADCYASLIKNNFNYEITRFEVKDSGNDKKLVFSGWAMIDHVDNYGGKNLDTYILVSLYADGRNSKRYKVTPRTSAGRGKWNTSEDWTIFESRTDKSDNVTRSQFNELVTKFNQGKKTFTNYAVTNSNDNALYYNIHFEESISLNELVAYFESDLVDFKNTKKNLYFFIESRITSPSGIPVGRSGIGFHKTACVFSNSNYSCPDFGGSVTIPFDDEFVHELPSGDSIRLNKVKFEALDNKFKLTGVNVLGRVFYSRYSNSFSVKYGYRFKPNIEYDIADTGNSFNGQFGYKVECNVPSDKSSNCTGGYGGGQCLSFPAITPGTADRCFLPASLGFISGNFNIELMFEEAKNECTCLGKNCVVKGAATSCKKNPPSTKKCAKTVNYNNCGKNDISTGCTHTVDTTDLYYRVSVNYLKEQIAKDEKIPRGAKASDVTIYCDGIKYNNGSCGRATELLIPVKFYGDVAFTQSGTLDTYHDDAWTDGKKFENGKPEVDTSRGFEFAMKYVTDASWIKPRSAYYNPIGYIYVSVKGIHYPSFKIVFDFDMNSENVVWNSRACSAWHDCELSMKEDVINHKDVVTHIVDSISKNSSSYFKNLTYVLKGSFPDSNTKDSSITSGTPRINPGDFMCNSITNTSSFHEECIYKIREAYFTQGASNPYCYGTWCNTGGAINISTHSNYFVPRYLDTGSSFDFSMVGNLGIVDGITIKYNSVCSLGAVYNQLKDHLLYRPISVNDPFPDDDYPTNWKEYMNDTHDNTLLRVKNSYERGIAYKTFVKYPRDFSIYSADYNSFSDVELDGTSRVVLNGGLFRTRSSNHCKKGEFKIACDPSER